MAAGQAGSGGQGPSLGAAAHDLRSALAAATAYLDLARERVARGEPLDDEDLALVEKGLARIGQALEQVESLARQAAPREGPR